MSKSSALDAQHAMVAVVCHGIEIISAAGVLKGFSVTTVAKCALDCTQGGGKYVAKPMMVDGNLVTVHYSSSDQRQE